MFPSIRSASQYFPLLNRQSVALTPQCVCFALIAMIWSAAGLAQKDDLAPIGHNEWNEAAVKHLLDRSGFGATEQDVKALLALSPQQAVRRVVLFEGLAPQQLPAFDESEIHDAGLEPFPPSRPAATALARKNGKALGVTVRQTGNRRLQPVVNRFFYWLRASVLETDRLAYWWANRMLVSNRPLEEKMALFWHGHFAAHESKVRDYRKFQQQLATFHRLGRGEFRRLILAVARGPAMLSFLDAGVNVKGSPNENFAREIMELFTMGVGAYGEADIREAARAFTGWNYRDLEFVVNQGEHDDGEKVFLGRSGRFDGEDIVDIILEQRATAEFLASKLYRYFVREDLSPALQQNLASVLRESGYHIGQFLQVVFLSKDFYSAASMQAHIKSPVELVVSTYRSAWTQASARDTGL